jgi:CRP-like cAMP-binding protein
MAVTDGWCDWTDKERFDDLDRALEHDEDERLRPGSPSTTEVEWDWRTLSPLDRLLPEQQDALRPCLVRQEFEAGHLVFRQGDAGDTLYLIARGAAEVFRYASHQPGEVEPGSVRADLLRHRVRLATFHAGSFFGEMAFLGGARRDASVLADGKLVVWSLRRQDLDDTAREDPEMVARLYEGLSLELAERLRQANRMIDALGR